MVYSELDLRNSPTKDIRFWWSVFRFKPKPSKYLFSTSRSSNFTSTHYKN